MIQLYCKQTTLLAMCKEHEKETRVVVGNKLGCYCNCPTNMRITGTGAILEEQNSRIGT